MNKLIIKKMNKSMYGISISKKIKSNIKKEIKIKIYNNFLPDFICLFPLIISLFLCNNLFNFTSFELKIFIAILAENLKSKSFMRFAMTLCLFIF